MKSKGVSTFLAIRSRLAQEIIAFAKTGSLSASGEEPVPSLGTIFPAVAIGLLRRSVSRGSSNRKSQARALGTRVSGATLCPLGQSKKAIRPRVSDRTMHCHSWSGHHQACCFRKCWRRHDKKMELKGRGKFSSASCVETNQDFWSGGRPLLDRERTFKQLG